MSETPSHLEIAYSSIRCFTDDGKLDEGELGFLLGLALRDGVIDDDEKRVLRSLFDRVEPQQVDDRVRERIRSVRSKHGI